MGRLCLVHLASNSWIPGPGAATTNTLSFYQCLVSRARGHSSSVRGPSFLPTTSARASLRRSVKCRAYQCQQRRLSNLGLTRTPKSQLLSLLWSLARASRAESGPQESQLLSLLWSLAPGISHQPDLKN